MNRALSLITALSAVALTACVSKAAPVAAEPRPEEEAPRAARDEPPRPPSREHGRRTAGVTNDVVRFHRAKFRACYDRAQSRDDGRAGTVTLVFVIRPDGVVKSAEVDRAKSDLHDEPLHACLVETVKAIRFPEADEEVGSKMHYPFEFKPSGAR